MALLSTFILAACNNSADKKEDTALDPDSFNSSEKKDLNNRNTVVYDSLNRGGDTGSYERMPNKVKDSVPQ